MAGSAWNLRRFNPENINPSTSSGVTKTMNFEIRLVKYPVSAIIKVEGITGRIILKPKSTFALVSVM